MSLPPRALCVPTRRPLSTCPASCCDNPLSMTVFALDIQTYSTALQSAFRHMLLSLDHLDFEQRGKILVGLHSDKPPSSINFSTLEQFNQTLVICLRIMLIFCERQSPAQMAMFDVCRNDWLAVHVEMLFRSLVFILMVLHNSSVL